MKRLEYADYAKALAILLVIVGHTHPGYLPGKDWLYMDICYAFHMPLFFFITGLVFKTRTSYSLESWRTFLRHNFLTLMLPYFIWGVVYMPFSYAGLLQLAYGSWMQLRELGTLTSLWFLPAMFVARVACETVHALAWKLKISDRIFAGLSIPVLFALGFLLPHHNSFKTGWGNVWQYDIGLMAGGYMLLGGLARPFFDRLAKARLGWTVLVCAVSAGLFAAGFFLERPLLTIGHDMMMQMCNADYGPWAWCLSNAITGCATALSFALIVARVIPGNRAILFVGANTMGLFILHKPLLWEMVKVSERCGLPVEDLLSAIPSTSLAFLLTLPLVIFFLRFAPVVFGKGKPSAGR